MKINEEMWRSICNSISKIMKNDSKNNNNSSNNMK